MDLQELPKSTFIITLKRKKNTRWAKKYLTLFPKMQYFGMYYQFNKNIVDKLYSSICSLFHIRNTNYQVIYLSL